MPNMGHLRRRGRATASVLCALTLLLAGCAASDQTAQSTKTVAVATPPAGLVVPPIHTIDLGNFQATVVFPTAHGLVLFGNPGSVGQPIGEADATALYYYDNDTKTVSVIATPTPSADGVQRGIRIAQAAGDWVVYYVGDDGDFRWEIWALNLATKQRELVASASAEQTPLAFLNLFMTDGTSMVWGHAILVNGVRQNILALYDLASGTSRTLLTLPATTVVGPEALVHNTLVFTEQQVDNTSNKTAWIWPLNEQAPKQISANVGLNFTLNDHYVIWDDIHARSLTLYDRTTGQQQDEWVDSCIRPHIVADRPYVVCVDFGTASYRLIRPPSSENTTFYDGQEGEDSIFTADGRAYWVATPKGSPYGHQIAYIELPQS